MPVIHLETHIRSDIKICFDLSRSIDLHKISTAKSKEEAIDGTITGLINFGESVTWQAFHFGIKQKLTSKITVFDSPSHFRDEQQKGAFKYFIHDHYFTSEGNNVIMQDIFNFQSPLGLLGAIADKLILTNYLKKLLTERNNIIKEFAETEKWKLILEVG